VSTDPAFTQGRGRPKDDPSSAAFRKVALLVDLVRDRSITTAAYRERYGIDGRTMQRDLSQLRKIGVDLGFSISNVRNGRVELTSFDNRPRALDAAKSDIDQLIARLGAAFGEPLLRQLGAVAERADGDASFIRFTTPVVASGSRVAAITSALREAMQTVAGRCRVRFTYQGREGMAKERVVEPAHIVVRSGRWFLVGYDTASRGWRLFALDAIVGMPQRAGTLATVRVVPEAYDNDDAVGFIKGDGAPIAVTVEVSAALAASVSSRLWQKRQKVEILPDGRARLTLYVWDAAEVVRWVFGFAPEAVIVAPPAAVALAIELARKIATAHGG
jgi:predicted DNA-binding transcriptional regulator YafY